MIGRSFNLPDRFNMYWKELLRQMVEIGIGSLFIVVLVNVFVGAVSSVQTAWTLYDSPLIPAYYISYVVRDNILIELCPTVTAIVLAGKVGSQITSELGSMRISEQIDALEIMGVPTQGYLVGPKILASIITIPLLICIGATLSMVVGMYAGDLSGFVLKEDFLDGLVFNYDKRVIYIMLTKAFVFAFIIAAISCYQGFFVRGGAIEIGRASTRAVVYSNVFIIISDYIILALMT